MAHVPRQCEPGMQEDCNGEPSIDVHLQVWSSGRWTLYTGDFCYVTDHNGYFGSGMVTGEDTYNSLLGLARDMREEAIESCWEIGELEEEGGE